MKTIKVWGTREILFKNNNVYITLLNLIGGTYSSLHNHKCKSDKFVLILGKVKIVTEVGETILFPGQSLIIDPPLLHQFIVEEDSIMIEISSTVLDPEDINRVFQGGKIVNGKMISLDDLNKLAKGRGDVMPYIKQIERDKFDKHIEELLYELCNNGLFEPGQMNYIISKLIKGIIKRIGISYSLCNNITGVLECVSKEFYRRTVAPYEDRKIIENGDI